MINSNILEAHFKPWILEKGNRNFTPLQIDFLRIVQYKLSIVF